MNAADLDDIADLLEKAATPVASSGQWNLWSELVAKAARLRHEATHARLVAQYARACEWCDRPLAGHGADCQPRDIESAEVLPAVLTFEAPDRTEES